jgi:hypothetical protein
MVMKRITNKLRVLLQIQRSLLVRYGWLRSWWIGRSVDASGAPLRWIAYPAIDFISLFDFTDANVFEWGSGFSTLWWASRCKHIASVESSPMWVPYIKGLLPESVDLIVTALDVEAEIDALLERVDKQHDVFVIDNNGPFRWRCAQAASANQAPAGSLFWTTATSARRHAPYFAKRGWYKLILRASPRVTDMLKARAYFSATHFDSGLWEPFTQR